MDANRFDVLTRSLHSRRRVVQTLAGLGAGLGIGRTVGASEQDVGTAVKKGSGTAAKKGGGSRFGCTKQDNVCREPPGNGAPCPGASRAPDSFCVINGKGKPLCAATGVCTRCKRNADCRESGPTAQCIKKCPSCLGAKSACVVPLTADMLP